jgi:hypothetical protein
MKPNYIPEGMTYTPADIAERNEYIDAFCAKVEPQARQAFESAVARQTETESAEAIVDEARSALAELLAAPEHQPQLDEESRKLIEALASALKERPELRDRKTEDAWIERRSKDLARAVVGFWANLGDDAPSRYKGSAVLLDEMIAGRDSERRRDFETIYSRFWLDSEEARQLLAYVEALGVVAPVVKRVQKKEVEDFAALFAKVVLVAEPMPVHALMAEMKIEPHVLKMPEYAPQCAPALDLIKAVDRINLEQYGLIQKELPALREKRIAALQANVALTDLAVAKAIMYCASGGPSLSTRLLHFLPKVFAR